MSYERLSGYLVLDPENYSLLLDTASAALSEGALEACGALLERAKARACDPALLNLEGLLALARRDLDVASAKFSEAVSQSDAPILKSNLAWALTLRGSFDSAVELLDDAVALAAPQGCALKVQALHHLGRLEEALAFGARHVERCANDKAFAGALALAALDAEEWRSAVVFAAQAGDTVDGLATRASLALRDGEVDRATLLFDEALEQRPHSPRALLGKGLCLLWEGDPGAAAKLLDLAAEAFRDHVGAWVAAGWAHFVAGDLAASRARFERARDLDGGFSEPHGALAVLDAVSGDGERGRRQAEISLRLDPGSFAGALARSLFMAADGNVEGAAWVRERALTTPIGREGHTIARAAALHARRRRVSPR